MIARLHPIALTAAIGAVAVSASLLNNWLFPL